MEWFSAEFFTVLFSIIIIDLVLAGDNAVVIGMAARNLPEQLRMKAILWGTGGAIAIRVLATFIVVWLLKIPGLLLAGGLMLLWIAYKLLVQKKEHRHIKVEKQLGAAIRTIMIADAVMGLDNVIAIAGAAQGSIVMVIIGLFISVPVIIWGSTLIMKWMEKYPIIIYIGAGVLAFTAGQMIVGERWFQSFFIANPGFRWLLITVLILGILITGSIKNRTRQRTAHP